jgi:hypothetical protein
MRCPVCRAENDDVTCRRCKADLTPLFALDTTRLHALGEAARAAAAGDGARTLERALAANRLRADQESARLLAIGYLLTRDFARALQYQQVAMSSTS